MEEDDGIPRDKSRFFYFYLPFFLLVDILISIEN
jgi:hypothetical protein